jgi:hypothetical protein
VTIVKFFLLISKEEQKSRLQARLDDPTKRWKFSPADFAERRLWEGYMSAYQLAQHRVGAMVRRSRRPEKVSATPLLPASSAARSKRWI